MKAIYLDCFAGISGNMLLGAFLQAGVPQAYLREQLSRLPVADEFILHIDEVKKNGIAALYVDVELTGQDAPHDGHEHEYGHEHAHTHGHEQIHHHAHVHRTMKDIRSMLQHSSLDTEVKQKALLIFEAVAAAEGKVHGMPPEDVHFH